MFRIIITSYDSSLGGPLLQPIIVIIMEQYPNLEKLVLWRHAPFYVYWVYGASVFTAYSLGSCTASSMRLQF